VRSRPLRRSTYKGFEMNQQLVNEVIRELDAVTGGSWERIPTGGGCEALVCPALINGNIGRVFLTDGQAGVDFFHPEMSFAALAFETSNLFIDTEYSDVDLNDVCNAEDFAELVASLMVRPDGSAIAQCFAGVI
jgi:hypothetical protein